MNETIDLVDEQVNKAVHANVCAQIADKGRKNTDHVKLSTIWNTTNNIKKILRELAQGYSFDYAALTALVNAMFGFINAVAKPDVTEAADVQVEEIVK